jgi:hypothetical protein
VNIYGREDTAAGMTADPHAKTMPGPMQRPAARRGWAWPAGPGPQRVAGLRSQRRRLCPRREGRKGDRRP